MEATRESAAPSSPPSVDLQHYNRSGHARPVDRAMVLEGTGGRERYSLARSSRDVPRVPHAIVTR